MRLGFFVVLFFNLVMRGRHGLAQPATGTLSDRSTIKLEGEK